jgi:hypothetical protein
MKLIILQIRILLLPLIIILCFQSEIFSQGTSSSKGEKPGIFAGISMGLSQSDIVNTGISSVSELVTEKKGSFMGFVDIGYFLSEKIGISSGIGLITYTSQQTLGSYQNKLNATDSDAELYERRITGSGITETQKIGTLSVPICIIGRFPVNEKIGLFVQPGLCMSIPISKDFNSNGTFTYKGYYSEYNVVFENLPAFGFPSNLNSSAEGDLELKPMIINFTVNAGVDYYLQKKIQLAFAVSYIKSLSGISDYSSPEKFQLSTDADEINSLMAGSTKATIQSIGIKVSLRYYLR